MVRLVIKAPLADSEGAPGILQRLHHVRKILLLVRVELVVVLGRANIHLMLGLRLRWLEGAGEYRNFRVLHLLWHLGVGEILVDDDAVHELRIANGSSGLPLDLDEVEAHVLAAQIGDREDSVYRDASELISVSAHDLGTKR